MIAIVSPNRIVSAGKSPLIYYTINEVKRGEIECRTREMERHGKSVFGQRHASSVSALIALRG